ncbi:dipeptide ABC transporter ATP-binding protein [Labrenzia sp. 011]|uniref:ABC transporter ATP-binding protein n=1 Tax=Labrenzia sp. 011 TaxID=2171494 RepID=UPI000D506A69|nr:dipeptide ABC transporter ATP-binding protein [Labrenzia sp. 011]PVB62434.1 oligopeptide ABC transporter ATP-binding protein [Labrenzia sp. 011]
MRPPTRDRIIETRAVTKRFPGRKGLFRSSAGVSAVNEVSLDIRRGETFSIVGESGCGKSTLARLLVRLLPPSGGEVLYEGNDISSLSDAEMRRLRKDLQFVFQDPFSSLNPRMTVGALIEEPMKVHTSLSRAERRRKVADLLARVGLRPAFANRYPHEFSGGQRQRIGIARALASGPRVIVGDEPVSALDVSVQAQVINLLEDLKDEFDLTLILIAHDLAVIRHMSDRIAVMYLGEIVELAPNDALFERPLHPYTQALMRAIPIASPHGRSMNVSLTGDVPSPLSPPSGCRFHPRCPQATSLCASEKPVLTGAGTGRAVACHHWETIAESTQAPVREPPRSTIAERRFALFRQRSQRQEPVTAATETENQAFREE